MANLVIQSFGKETELRRAVLTILSFYSYSSQTNNSVFLFTDRPEWFIEYLKDIDVKYILLTPDKVKRMRGTIDFLHRMKIELIAEAFELTNGDLLYADSDTFFTADPSAFMQKVSPGKSFMHVKEYEFEELRSMALPAGAPFQAFLSLIEKNVFKTSDNDNFKISTSNSSWNAGVIMFHNSHKSFLTDVFALTDQFYPSTRNHASEQYAFSIVLQSRTDLSACDEVVYHYWYRIKKEIIDLFLEDKLPDLLKLSLDKKKEIVRSWTKTLPVYLDKHLLTLKDNAIQNFNDDRYLIAYKWVGKALLRNVFIGSTFARDVLYHTKRRLIRRTNQKRNDC